MNFYLICCAVWFWYLLYAHGKQYLFLTRLFRRNTAALTNSNSIVLIRLRKHVLHYRCKSGLEKLTNANRSSRFTNNRQFLWASRKLPIGRFRAHGNCRSAVSVTIGRFLIYGKECILTWNSIIFPSYTLFLVIYGFKKTISNISDIRR